MALHVGGALGYGHSPKPGFSHVYLTVAKSLLSLPFQLTVGPTYEVVGTLLKITRSDRVLIEEEMRLERSFENRHLEMQLAVTPLGDFDVLYFKEDLWENIRDSGFVSTSYEFHVKLHTVKIGPKEIQIYPLRDL